jgi:hypothetical protein
MAVAECYACKDCERDLTAALLVHKKIPNTEDTRECEFCKQRRLCAKYKIRYGRDTA